MRWLVTGGCGFIGRNLVQLLCERGEDVRVLDNLSVGARPDLEAVGRFVEVDPARPAGPPTGLELVVGDVRDRQAVDAAASGADVIVHLAARTGVIPSVQDPLGDCETNVIGTLNCLEAARHRSVSRFVFASSGAPIGNREPPLHEEMAPRPVSPYGASKLAGEGYCSAYHGSYGLGTVALRFSNVYGPLSGKKESVVARFVRQALDGEPLVVYGDGSQTRDYLYVGDLVRCIVAAGRSSLGGELFQVATGKETPLNELLDALAGTLASEGVPQPEIVREPARSGEVLRSGADISKVARALGWAPETSLGEGLRHTVRWFVRERDRREA